MSQFLSELVVSSKVPQSVAHQLSCMSYSVGCSIGMLVGVVSPQGEERAFRCVSGPKSLSAATVKGVKSSSVV